MLIARAARLARYAYAVPWCVPQWGWREAAATVLGSVSRSGESPGAFAEAARVCVGGKFALPLGMGRMAIEVGLRGLGVAPDDDVVLPSYVCPAVLQAVHHTGARPVFADVGAGLNVTLASVLAALTPRTRCVIVPHLFGAPAPIGAIERALRDQGIPLLDDAAQALGASVEGRPVGSFGDCGVVSCGPGKPLAGSAGGVLVMQDPSLFDRASSIASTLPTPRGSRRRVLRFWGTRRFRRLTLPIAVAADRLRTSSDVGGERDYRLAGLSEVDARLGLAQLGRLDATTARRRGNAALMLAALGPWARYNVVNTGPGTASMKLALVLPEDGPDVAATIAAFAEGGVECQPGYAPCHLGIHDVRASVPWTERVWQRVVCVPLETRLADPRRLTSALRQLVLPPSGRGVRPEPSAERR